MRSLVVVLTAALCLAVSGCPKNVNPDTPLPPMGAVSSKVGTTCRFKVTASDPDFHRVSVRVDWDDGDTSDWSGLFYPGDTMTLEYAWPVPGDFRVSAQAKDERGAVSLWSNWHVAALRGWPSWTCQNDWSEKRLGLQLFSYLILKRVGR